MATFAPLIAAFALWAAGKDGAHPQVRTERQ